MEGLPAAGQGRLDVLFGIVHQQVIAGRMARAQSEISHWDGYDYVVINDDVEACYTQVCEILHAERMKRARQTGLIGFVRGLMKD